MVVYDDWGTWAKRAFPISCCSVLPATRYYLVDPPPQDDPPVHLYVTREQGAGEDCSGTYIWEGGSYNDAPVFVLSDPERVWVLWWSTSPHGWFITPEAGVPVAAPGSMWSKLTDLDPNGTYDAQAPADADVIVSEEEP